MTELNTELAKPAATDSGSFVEIVPEALYAVGGVLDYDTRLSWAPPDARGSQPVNAYLLLGDGGLVLVDTGVAAHRDDVIAGLSALLPAGQLLSIFLTRSEYECVGNLPAISKTFPISGLFTGGVTNPFDAFDEIASPHALWNRRVRLGSASVEQPVRVGNSESLLAFAAPLRILTTYWAYDERTKTLFTSDTFGHGVMANPAGPRMLIDASSCATAETVRDTLLAKFSWLEHASKIRVLADAIQRVFERFEVEIIAPTHGLPIVGRALVQRHQELMLDLLSEFERRLDGAGKLVSPSFDLDSVAAGIRLPARAKSADSPSAPTLPRPLAANVQWLGKCIDDSTTDMRGAPHHSHLSQYLVSGTDATLLVDTGVPSGWPAVEQQLRELLGNRPIDYVFPTHSEYPHSGNLEKLMQLYPTARVVGDVRDYHAYFPEIGARTLAATPGTKLDLGGGTRVTFLPGILRDLPSTLWLYEEQSQILFVADGFGFFHREPAPGEDDDDDSLPVHDPGECALMISELDADLEVVQASTIVRNALSWSRYLDATPLFREIEELLTEYPARVIAPAHGNVIDSPQDVLPLIEASHAVAFTTGKL